MKLLFLLFVIGTAALVIPGDCQNIRQTRGSSESEWNRRQVEEAPESEKPWYKHATIFLFDQAKKYIGNIDYNAVKNKFNEWSSKVSSWLGNKREAAFYSNDVKERFRRYPDFHYVE